MKIYHHIEIDGHKINIHISKNKKKKHNKTCETESLTGFNIFIYLYNYSNLLYKRIPIMIY